MNPYFFCVYMSCESSYSPHSKRSRVDALGQPTLGWGMGNPSQVHSMTDDFYQQCNLSLLNYFSLYKRGPGGATRTDFRSHCRVDVLMLFGRNGVTFTSTGPSCAVLVPGALEHPRESWTAGVAKIGRHRMMSKAEEGNCTMGQDPRPLADSRRPGDCCYCCCHPGMYIVKGLFLIAWL